MFSTGQWIFFVIAILVFFLVMAIAYRQDKKFLNYHYKKSYIIVLVVFIAFLAFLFILRFSLNF